MHFVFGNELPLINSQAPPSQIQEWKCKSVVRKCYSNLFKRIRQDQPTTFMSKILERLRRVEKTPSKNQLAYAISVCEAYLCTDNQTIQMNENIIKPKIVKNLVSFNFNFA
jgi:hypothetical protein